APEPRLRRVLRVLQDVIYGMVLHDMVRLQTRDRAGLEHLFILITMGDLIGVPILPPYYSLRLLPYVVPGLEGWKRRLLRETDIGDIFGWGRERRQPNPQPPCGSTYPPQPPFPRREGGLFEGSGAWSYGWAGRALPLQSRPESDAGGGLCFTIPRLPCWLSL